MLSIEWTHRLRLDGLLTTQGEDFDAIAAHARRWVCDPGGFTTSRLCLLAPLGDALEQVASAFAALTSAVDQDWSDVRRDTARSLTSYAEVDDSVSDGLHRLAGRLS